MSKLSRMVKVNGIVDKDSLNTLKTKGADTVISSIAIEAGISENAGSILEFAANVKSLGLKWCMGMDVMPLYKSVISEVGADNRMFVRKSERGAFENVHKLFTAMAEKNAVPEFIQIDSDIYSSIENINLSFEEQTRMINVIINAVKAVSPSCKIIFSTKESVDNEKAKKWFNRFQVSGGKPFDIISLQYEINAETFYALSMNMSDLSRRFGADIIVDVSGQADVAEADISVADLDSAIEIVPQEHGFGTVYSAQAMNTATMVA